jgi:hypothetical protein
VEVLKNTPYSKLPAPLADEVELCLHRVCVLIVKHRPTFRKLALNHPMRPRGTNYTFDEDARLEL